MAVFLAASGQLYACNTDTGERKQQISASWGGEDLVAIQYHGDDLTYFELPSGKKLGVGFKEAGKEVYTEQGKWRTFNVELIHVAYFDATAKPIKRIKEGLSGANGTSALDESYLPGIGDQKLRIEFNKPVCIPTGVTHSVDPSAES
jgi:hypothetical protein